MKFSQVWAFARMVQSVAQLAREELVPLLAKVDWERKDANEVVRLIMRAVLEKYSAPSAELGTQWYDLCAEEGEQPGTRIVGTLPQSVGQAGMDATVQSILDRKDDLDAEIENALSGVIVEYVKKEAKNAILSNLDADQAQFALQGTRYSRRRYGNKAPGFCSVPTGVTTCAYCIMEASRGYVFYDDFRYKRQGGRPNIWHSDCDCIVVPYVEATEIEGYENYDKYAEMYRTADDLFKRVHRGESAYPPELQARVEGLGPADTNRLTRERLVVMRYLYGLEH